MSYVTQRQLAAQGKRKAVAACTERHIRAYDFNEAQCAAFVRGLLFYDGNGRFPRPTEAEAREAMESYIASNALNGGLLRSAFAAALKGGVTA